MYYIYCCCCRMCCTSSSTDMTFIKIGFKNWKQVNFKNTFLRSTLSFGNYYGLQLSGHDSKLINRAKSKIHLKNMKSWSDHNNS